MLAGIDLLLIGCFLHSSWRKVFYSQHLIRVVSFGLARDTPWTQIRSLHLIQEKRRTRMILETAEKRITLRSDTLTDGWGDFGGFRTDVSERTQYPIRAAAGAERKAHEALQAEVIRLPCRNTKPAPSRAAVWTDWAKVSTL